MTFSIGENVGPYRIVEQLGQGGMATVFKAYHAALDRYVAIKVMHAAFKEDANFLARFQREARVVAKLEHPNIVPVYDYAEHEGSPYLVMKFIEGETLKARLARGPLTVGETRRVIEQVGAGLDYAHKQGILHRDIKPSNVMLARDGGIYLADFGLARIAMAGESTLSTDSMLGTPHYMSPEQAKGLKNLDAGTDIYSFGVVAYELTVGRVPYNADTPFAIIHDHIFSPLPLPHVVNPKVSEAVERVLLKALAKDRADRYTDVAAFVSAFLEVSPADAGATVMASAPGAARGVAPGAVTAAAQASLPGAATVLAGAQSGAPAPAGATVVSAVSAGPQASAATQAAASLSGVAAAQPAQAPSAAGTTKNFPCVWVGLAGVALVLLVVLLGLGLLRGVVQQKARATASARQTETAVLAAATAVPSVVTPGSTGTPPPPPPTAPSLPPGVLYMINLDNGQAPGWQLDPAWKVSGGELCGASQGFAGLDQSNGGASWGDYREAFFLTLQSGGLNANFRQQVGGRQAGYLIGFTSGSVTLSRQAGGKPVAALQTWTGPISPGIPHAIEIMGQGPRVMVTMDKQIAIDYTDGQPITQGGISFETLDNSLACVSQVEVDTLPNPLPPPQPSPVAADLSSIFAEAGQMFDANAADKGFAILNDAVQQNPQNTQVLLTAGDTALEHGPQFAQQALTRYYAPAEKIERDQKDDLASLVTAHTLLAMYAAAQDPSGGDYFNKMAQTFQPAEWPLTAKVRWDLFAPNADLNAVSKELADQIATYPNNLVLYLIRGDLNLKEKHFVMAGDNYAAVTTKWSKDNPLWVLTEAQCRVSAIKANRLNSSLELTCESLSSLVTGK